MEKLRVGIVYGGRSVEHEVSIASATSILQALDPSRYERKLIAIAQDGRWRLGAPGMLPASAVKGEEVTLPAVPRARTLLWVASGTAAAQLDVILPAANGYRNFMVTNYLSGQRLKRRSGRLVSSWQAQLVDENTARVSPGLLPYARVHEYGLDYPFQPVRGYTTRAGRQVRMYFRDMKLKATHYVTDTVRLGGKYVHAQIDAVVKRMGSA